MNLSRFFNQKAVYWSAPVPDGFGGFTYAAPAEIDVRWEERIEQYTDMSGEIRMSQAIVYSSTDFDIGCYLLKGTLINVTDPGYNPQKEAAAFKIMMVAKTPDMRGMK